MGNEFHFGNKEEILKRIYNLIIDNQITSDERIILTRAKNNLENGQNLERTALQLKKELSPIMAQNNFSEEGLIFFKNLSSEYVGLGRKGSVFIL